MNTLNCVCVRGAALWTGIDGKLSKLVVDDGVTELANAVPTHSVNTVVESHFRRDYETRAARVHKFAMNV